MRILPVSFDFKGSPRKPFKWDENNLMRKSDNYLGKVAMDKFIVGKRPKTR